MKLSCVCLMFTDRKKYPIYIYSDPYLHLPHLSTARPLVKCNETFGWVVVVVVVVVGGKVATNFSVSSRQGFKLEGLSL